MPDTIHRKTAQQIVDTVKDVSGQNINFINDKAIIIASTNASRVNTFHEIGRQVLLSGTTIEVNESENYYGTQEGVNIPILHNGTPIAVIGISGPPEEVRKYAYLAQRITSLILRERDMDMQTNNRRSRMNYVIRSLIQNESMTPQYLADFLAEYLVDPEQNYYTLLVRLNPGYHPNNLSLIEQQIFQTFEATQSPLYTFLYPNEYILLLGEKEYKSRWYLFSKLAENYGKLLKIALGNLQPLTRQHLSYQAAEISLKSLGRNQSLAVYSDLDLDLILGNVSEIARETFLAKTVAELDEDDILLLQAYFEEDCSLLHTSERLHMHKNTLQYRLDRIHRLCGYNPRSFRDAVVLYSALKLI